MARQSINVNPSLREFEAYMDFSGGLNTETSNERLNENEFTQMVNVDLNSRGSVKKRTGRDLLTTTGLPTTNPQGLFFFYRKKTTQTEPDIIFAVNGKLYVKKYDAANGVYFSSASLLNITGMTTGFATNIIIEAVQYYDQLYVATGTNLVVVTVDEVSGTYSAKVVEPYEPNSNEIKYLGTNALLGFTMTDKTDTSRTQLSQFEVKGMTFSEEGTDKLLINAETKERFIVRGYVIDNPLIAPPSGSYYFKTFKFYYKKAQSERTETITYTATSGQTVFDLPANSTYDPNTNSIEVSVDGAAHVSGVHYTETDNNTITFLAAVGGNKKVTLKWIPSWWSGNSSYGTFAQNGSASSNEFVFRPLEVGYYDFKIETKFAFSNGTSETAEYVYQGLQVKAFKEDGDILEQVISGVKKCNRIRLHWDRLMLFGDPDEPTQLYFSDVNNPAYFPQVNTLRFDTGKQEPITSVVRLNDYLVVFSKSLIHILTGKTKDEFSINLINDTIGCIAPRSAVLTGNVVTFLSEEGVFQLRPSTFKLDQLNVQRADTKIKSEIKKVSNVCALNYDSQYWLCYPDDKVIYRYYYEKGVWVKDVSDKLNFVQFLQDGQNVYSLSKDVKLYKNNTSVYKDANSGYNIIVETKYFDLSKSFNFKKLKRLHMLARAYNSYDVNYKVYVYADSAIVLTPDTGYASIDANDYVVWNTTSTPNVKFVESTIFGNWELGEDAFGDRYLDVQKARVQGKCRRVKVRFENDQDQEVEIFGFGLEFKLKKP